ncbi:MAG: translation initiation factor IF-2 [Candidatus Paceibacterota bacterium]|jgi:translation initiation factor IF-2
MQKTEQNLTKRPPIVAVVGHIDHGKSTLLDYIRKSNIVENEAGGITQHIGAYEVVHDFGENRKERITFLDTPGHEAFSKMRVRGAKVADVVILVVSADDKVNVQTLEAVRAIQEANVQYVVAINKIDRPNANIEKIKQEFAENQVFLEGYGGNIPNVLISAKTGQGVPELLDTILLIADMADLKKNDSQPASGVVIESNLDPKKGPVTTLIIKNGTLKTGSYLIVDNLSAPVRMMCDASGAQIKSANASSPVLVMGFSEPPKVGSCFISADDKKEAQAMAETNKDKNICAGLVSDEVQGTKLTLPILIRSDFLGTLEAVEKEIKKLETPEVKIKVAHAGVGNITEADIKMASTRTNPVIVGFNVKIDRTAIELAEKLGVERPQTFDIIYLINKFLEEKIKERMPKEEIETVVGKAQILKTFGSAGKDKQIIGGRVYEGVIAPNKAIKIIRQQKEIAKGQLITLQSNKVRVKELKKDEQFGAMIESKIDIAPGDLLEIVDVTLK